MFKGAQQREDFDGVEVIRVRGLFKLPFKVYSGYLNWAKNKFDIVVEEAIGGQRPPFLASLYVREPLVAVWHQKNDRIFREQYPFPLALFLTAFEKIMALLYRNRILITPSLGAKEKILELGLKKERVKVVYNGVGHAFKQAKKNEKRQNTIVCLGKLRRYKRFDHALLAFQRVLPRTSKSCKLVIAGKVSEIDRGYVEWLRRLAVNLGIQEDVEFRLNISESEKLELLQKAKVLIQPSPIEGFGIVVIEANSCGTPVIVSSGVPNDVVVDGYNGFVYSYGNLNTLSSKIVGLIEDNALWDRTSKNAYDWAQRFSWKKSALEFEEILYSVASDKLRKHNFENRTEK